jgi:transcription-repair coupling factor (superfamily II helicase)
MQMVEEAVQRLRGTEVEQEPDPTLHINVSAFIPEDYVPDAHHRLSLYKRLTSASQVGDLALLHGEMQDRYGPLPDPVERLFEVMQVRVLAKALRLAAVEVRPGGPPTIVLVTFDAKAAIPEAGMRKIMDRYQRRFRLLSPLAFELQIPHADWPTVALELTETLHLLRPSATPSPAAAG